MKESRIYKIAEAMFQVQPGEARRTLLMFVYLLLGMSAFILGRTVKSTLFLTYYKVSNLPYMYIAVAVVMAAMAAGYSRIVDRFRRDRLIFGVDILFAALVIGFYGLIAMQTGKGAGFKPGDWVFPAFYILIEAMGLLIVVTFWTFANDLFTSREAKRLFSIIGAGGVLANVVCGSTTTWLVKGGGLGTVDLILLTAAYLFVCALVIRLAGRGTSFTIKPPQAVRHTANFLGDIKDVMSSRHLRFVAMVVAVMSVVITLVDYQYMVSLKKHYTGDQLTVFQSWFVMGTGIFGCVMQFFFTGRLVERFGIMVALLFLPLGMGSGLIYFIPTVALAGAVVAQASNYVFRYTVNDSTMQLLYIPVQPAKRGRAKAFIDGMLKQIANGTAGLLLILLNQVRMPLNRIAIIPAVAIGLWLFLLTRVKREYLKSLMDTLKKRSLDLAATGINASDEGTVKTLSGILTDPATAPDHLLHAMDLVVYVKSPGWASVLTALLSHADPRIRNRALELLGSLGWSVDIKEMMKCMQDADEQVRATAIQAYCNVLKERAVAGVKGALRDPSPMIRAAAVSGLIRHCGLDGILEAADTLKKMIENRDDAERFWGARTMRQIAVPNFYHTLFRLLGDSSLEVEKEAIAAAGEMRSKELVPALIYKLGRKGAASVAASTLARYGDDVVDTLYKVLANTGERREIRLRVPRVLSEIGTPRALEAFMKCLGEPDGVLRLRMVSYLSKFRRQHLDIMVDDAAIIAQIREDIRHAYQDAVTIRDLKFETEGWNILREALEIRFKRHVATALRLIECLYPQSQMSIIIANLSSDNASLRANAIEAIDNMVSRSIGRQIIPLIESGDPASRDDLFDDVGGIRSMEREAWLKDLLKGPDPWLAVCTLCEIKTHGPATLMPLVAGTVRSSDTLVRETALYAMLQSGAPLVDPEVLEDLTRDKSPLVAGFARELLAMIRPPVPEATQ
ncbi:MAG: hypothetical protein HY897_16630 [Deltaproteobacteria bacterium]|nr:hypothetical protein [Deltaproteobacteria bacterium]